jgi:hypothetical protein
MPKGNQQPRPTTPVIASRPNAPNIVMLPPMPPPKPPKPPPLRAPPADVATARATVERAERHLSPDHSLADADDADEVLGALDDALDTLGHARELGWFLRALEAAARLALDVEHWSRAETYTSTLVDLAGAQGLRDWALLGRTLHADVVAAQGHGSDALTQLTAVLSELSALGQENTPLFGAARDRATALRAHLTAPTDPAQLRRRAVAIARGHLLARRYEQARDAALSLEGEDLDTLIVRAEIVAETGPRATALPLVGRLGASAKRSGALAIEARAHRLAGALATTPDDRLHHGQLALSRFVALGDDAATARTLAALAEAHAEKGDVDSARAAASRSREHAKASGDLDAEVAARLAEAASSGSDLAARTALDEAYRLSAHEGSVRLRMAVLTRLGRLDDANALATQTGWQP